MSTLQELSDNVAALVSARAAVATAQAAVDATQPAMAIALAEVTAASNAAAAAFTEAYNVAAEQIGLPALVDALVLAETNMFAASDSLRATLETVNF